MNNILDVKPNIETVIIGTLYKEMTKKPCILSNLVGVLRDDREKRVNYCSPEDYLVLEDSSGRIRIKKSSSKCEMDPKLFVTGSILGCKGYVDQNGFFEVSDYCYAGLNPEHMT
jgi:DNA polymerase delta subunit 2